MKTIKLDPDLAYATHGFSIEELELLGRQLRHIGDSIRARKKLRAPANLPPKVNNALHYLIGAAFWDVRGGKRGHK